MNSSRNMNNNKILFLNLAPIFKFGTLFSYHNESAITQYVVFKIVGLKVVKSFFQNIIKRKPKLHCTKFVQNKKKH